MVNYQEDTRLIDFVGAVAAGFALQYQAWVSIRPLLPYEGMLTANNVKYALLYMAGFALSAAIVCVWKSRLRNRIGWLLIAILGSALCTGINEYFSALAFKDEPMVLFEGFELVLFNFAYKTFTSLFVIGAVHYAVLLLRKLNIVSRFEGFMVGRKR